MISKNIEISGVLNISNENVTEIVKTLAQVL